MKQAQKIGFKIATSLAILAMVLLFPCRVSAQQDPVYTQYQNNISSVNPAYAGVRGVGSVSAISRKQWLNMENSPFTSSLSLSLPLDSMKIAGGLNFLYDNLGPVTTTALFLDYSYRIRASETSQLSFGLKGGFNYLQANLTHLDRYHYDDSYILEYGDYSKFMYNFGVGLLWHGENFYAGFAVPRLLQNRYHKEVLTVESASREERHYLIHGAYLIDISPKLAFKPGFSSILVAGAPATASFDLGFIFNERIWMGATYRISDAVGAYLHLQLDNFKVGFLYEYTTSDLGMYNNGTIEVMLRYDFRTRTMFGIFD